MKPRSDMVIDHLFKVLVVMLLLAVMSSSPMSVRKQLIGDPPAVEEEIGIDRGRGSPPEASQQIIRTRNTQTNILTSQTPSSDQFSNLQATTTDDEAAVQQVPEEGQQGSTGQQELEPALGAQELDQLFASLGLQNGVGHRNMLALLHSLVVDARPEDLALIRDPSQGKREGLLDSPADGGLPGFLDGQLEGGLDGQVDGRLDGGLDGQGEDVAAAGTAPQQQMAEFTLEPHLGPVILPFEMPDGYFVPFLPRRAFGVVNGVARPPHGHGSFYVHRPPGLVDVANSPAYGFLFSGYRRFQPDALPHTDTASH